MRATQFVESYFDAWNDSDAKGVADHLAADGIYCDVPENEQSSYDELITSLSDFFSKFRLAGQFGLEFENGHREFFMYRCRLRYFLFPTRRSGRLIRHHESDEGIKRQKRNGDG